MPLQLVGSGTITGLTSLSLPLTGLLKGTGSSSDIAVATAGTDYAPATTGTAIFYGNGSGGFSNVTIGTGLSFSAGTLATIGSGSGSVTSVSVVSANGFAGTVANPTTTPAITLTTSLTGLLKGDGTAMSAAVSGTDYLAPPSGTALLKANSGGALANATAGTDYIAPPSGTALLKANSGGALANAVSGTDYAPATSGSSILYGNAGGFSNVTIGTGLSFSTGTLSATTTGTVSSVSFTGGIVSVATATTTPALTVAGTSGGIPYFSSGTTWATSAALTASAIVIGGGAGVAPSTTTTGAGVVTAVGNAVNTTGGLVTVDGSATLTNKTLTNPTVTNYTETPFTANTSTAITLALTNGTVQILTLTGSPTITMPTAVSGKSFIIMLKTGAGSYTVTWSTVKWPAGTAPTITSTASRQDVFSFFSDGTNWYGATLGQNYTP